MSKTFSESWHRVSEQNIALRPQVRVRRQYFRGELWYVVEDSYNNQFFRLRPAAYEFVSRLHPKRTVDSVWQEVMERYPNHAPGQDEVIQLLAQLYHANLLLYNAPSDSRELFERYSKRRKKEIQSKLLSIMFARIPLWDPDAFLVRMGPLLKPLFGFIGALLWFGVVGYAVKLVLEHFPRLQSQTEGVLAPSNLVLLYLSMVLIKTLHELGHAFACRHFGGEVHVMGIMLLVFTPIPYMDASASWAFRSRWQRLLVAAAGMIVEIFVAAIAVFVWANTAPGVVHSLAYNMIFIASVSTILFNINPLLRFDGYYMLTDLLDMPNLHQHGRRHLTHLTEHYAFGCERSTSPAVNLREASILTVFGIASGIYRVIVFTGIVFFVADQFLLAGLLMAAVCIVSWGVVPIFRLLRYLASSPKLERNRSRAIAVCSSLLAVLVGGLYLLPAPAHFRAPGVLEAREFTQVSSEVAGIVESVDAESGVDVTAGQVLLQLRNHELGLQLVSLREQARETELRIRQALAQSAADLSALNSRLDAIRKRVAESEQDKLALVIRAPFAGRWSAPDLDDRVGTWIARGSAIGELIDDSDYRFSAVVSQDDAKHLFNTDAIRAATVRLHGQSGTALETQARRIVPGEQRTLPSAALGWAAGGDVATDFSDQSGRTSAASFYIVEADIDASTVDTRHGLTGKIRFTLPP
ncbi:MAG: putative peptide zinc metalloprotease protein, partial [Rhodothermales bacterium]